MAETSTDRSRGKWIEVSTKAEFFIVNTIEDMVDWSRSFDVVSRTGWKRMIRRIRELCDEWLNEREDSNGKSTGIYRD